jgi:tetratricopeptide (TPR) repeat protein
MDFAERKPDLLIDHARALLRLSPHHALAWYALGTGAALREDWQKAVRAYESAARVVSSPELLNDWAWALYRLQRMDDALEVAVKATADGNGRTARAWATRGLIELESGRPQEAIASFTNALARGSRGKDLLEALERAYRSVGDDKRAERVRQELLKFDEVSATSSP